MIYVCEYCRSQILDVEMTDVFVCNGKVTYLVDNVANIKHNESYGCIQNNALGCINVGGIECSACGHQLGMALLDKDIRDQFIFQDEVYTGENLGLAYMHKSNVVPQTSLNEYVYALDLLEVENTIRSKKVRSAASRRCESKRNSLEEYASALEALETENTYKLQISTLRNHILRNSMQLGKLDVMTPRVNDYGDLVFGGIFLLLLHSVSIVKE